MTTAVTILSIIAFISILAFLFMRYEYIEEKKYKTAIIHRLELDLKFYKDNLLAARKQISDMQDRIRAIID